MVVPIVFLVGKLGSNNMLAIGNTSRVRAIAFWTSIVSTTSSWSKLVLTFGSWVRLGSITSSWVGLTRQTTSTSMLVSLDLCTPVITCSYLSS